MEVQTPGQAFTAFLGALGFTRPVEQLELRSVPLPSLLFWLRRPKGINLVEATMPAGEAGSTSACRSMAIAVSEEMLYKDKCPLVGVGLVYTPPYVPRVQFSVAYMILVRGVTRPRSQRTGWWEPGLCSFTPQRRVNSCLLQRSIRPSGRVRHGGPGQHRDVRAATLIERVQATHGMDPAPRGGQGS